MPRRTVALAGVGLILSILTATDAAAGSPRTYVASKGDDANPSCSLLLPCRTFPAAMAQTNPGGHVIVLDSAGYGTFTITKSVSIIVPAGVFAGLAPGPGGNGVVIDVPGGNVRLQGLTISGNGGNAGIKVVNALTVVIERCEVVGMSGDGISSASGAVLELVGVTSQRNAGNGLSVTGGGAHVNGSRFESNSLNGIFASNGADLSISASAANTNGGNGVLVDAAAGFVTRGTAQAITAVNNTLSGAIASASGTGSAALDISGSTVSRNANGVIATTTGGGATSYVTATANMITANLTNGVLASGVGAYVVASGNTVSRSSVGVSGAASGAVYSSGNAYAFNGTNVGGGVFPFSPF